LKSSDHIWRIDLHLRPSRLFLSALTLLHTAAAGAIFAAALAWPVRLVLLMLVCVSAWFCVRAEMRQAGCHLRERISDWWLAAPGHDGIGALLMRSRVWRYLVVLEFRERGSRRRYRLVFWPDTVTPDEFRRLRVSVWLRRRPGDDEV
jgi:hypothetical protein